MVNLPEIGVIGGGLAVTGFWFLVSSFWLGSDPNLKLRTSNQKLLSRRLNLSLNLLRRGKGRGGGREEGPDSRSRPYSSFCDLASSFRLRPVMPCVPSLLTSHISQLTSGNFQLLPAAGRAFSITRK